MYVFGSARGDDRLRSYVLLKYKKPCLQLEVDFIAPCLIYYNAKGRTFRARMPIDKEHGSSQKVPYQIAVRIPAVATSKTLAL